MPARPPREPTSNRSRQAGMVYVAAILVLASLSTLGLALLRTASWSATRAGNHLRAHKVRLAADSGVEYAGYLARTGARALPFKETISIEGVTVRIDAKQNQDDPDGLADISVTATDGETTRTAARTISVKRDAFEFAVCCNDTLSASAGLTIGLNGSLGDVYCNSDFLAGGKTTVEGGLSVGGTVNGNVAAGHYTQESAPRFDIPIPDLEYYRDHASTTLTGTPKLGGDSVPYMVDGIVFVEGDATVQGSIFGKGTIVATGSIDFTGSVVYQAPDNDVVAFIAGQEILVDRGVGVVGALCACNQDQRGTIHLERGAAVSLGCLVGDRIRVDGDNAVVHDPRFNRRELREDLRLPGMTGASS
jgi:hypothetical protein